jgi:hypothetical protein
MENDLTSKYVVAQPILSPSDAPLSFTWLQARQFLDRMQSRVPVRVFRENSNQFREGIQELGVSLR